MANTLFIEPKMTNVRKFYFLEYFYILLKSVEEFSNEVDVFEKFISLKEQYLLGESKYKKLISAGEELSLKKLVRYEYTFKEVVEESEMYGLIKKKNNEYTLLSEGKLLIEKFRISTTDFNGSLFALMENRFHGFYSLINSCYKANKRKEGLLIFPIYSPPKLNIQKSEIKKTKDIIKYIDLLTVRLESDILQHLQLDLKLTQAKQNLIGKLKAANLLSETIDEAFNQEDYYVILKRIRDFWLSYFLNEIYGFQMSISYFDIWCYRGKQFGIINATEFYYNFSGKIVYPISIVNRNVKNEDFKKLIDYVDGNSLYIHSPKFDRIQEVFSRLIYESYIDIKIRFKTYFINLADLRDLVCFKLKISYEKFAECLENLYQMNLKGETKIQIALEADKLPNETNAMYLTREPIIIDGKIRNIIAINIKK